jgi:hypothetical protein
MNITLTEEQLRDLAFLAELGRFVRERTSAVPDAELDRIWTSAIVPLLSAAREAGIDGISERRDEEDDLHGDLVSETDSAMAAYDDETFWFELEGSLGERDFYQYGSDDEIDEAERSGRLPERVEWYYRKYRKEFDEHGVDRLEINEDF